MWCRLVGAQLTSVALLLSTLDNSISMFKTKFMSDKVKAVVSVDFEDLPIYLLNKQMMHQRLSSNNFLQPENLQ